MRIGSSLPVFIFADHLGSSSRTYDTNTNGFTPPVAPQLYLPFGSLRGSTTNALPTDYTYTGQKADVVTGLMYYGARWYDSYLNRWAQPDSIIPEASQGVQAWDRYAFVNNNPVKYNDPSGHCLILCTAIAGAIAGALVDVAFQVGSSMISGQNFGQAISNINYAEVGGAAVAGLIAGATLGVGTAIATSLGIGATIGEATAVGVATGALGNGLGGQAGAATQAALNQTESLLQGQEFNTIKFTNDATSYGFGNPTKIGVDTLAGGIAGGIGENYRFRYNQFMSAPKMIETSYTLGYDGSYTGYKTYPLYGTLTNPTGLEGVSIGVLQLVRNTSDYWQSAVTNTFDFTRKIIEK